MKQIAILGRQDKLGLAELSAQVGGANIQPHGNGFVELTEPLDNPDEFGGIVRLVEPLETLPTLQWHELLQTVEEIIYRTSAEESGKINLAIQIGTLKVPFRKYQADVLRLKKRLKQSGYSIRIVMPKNGTINAAQVKASKLAAPGNYEIIPVQTGDMTAVTRTVWCQDIDAYAKRDYDRPMRDGFVGMLPPKLAQIMLNLAQLKPDARVLDPFCGTGVVLQEALLKGYSAYGSDLAEKMVDYSQQNLTWLRAHHENLESSSVEAGDARNHRWSGPIDAVVCETYLGNPQTSIPNDTQLKQLRKESAHLITNFLTNLHSQLKPGTPIVLAIPAWKTKNGQFIDSPVVDSINRLGYTRTKLEHVSNADLIYYRPDQFVARRILVLTRQ